MFTVCYSCFATQELMTHSFIHPFWTSDYGKLGIKFDKHDTTLISM